MREECETILKRLSDAELLIFWEQFGTYPTTDRRQRERLRWLLVKEGYKRPKRTKAA